MSKPLKLETKFKIKDDPEKKLKNAQFCAKELSSIECSWHNKCAEVNVTLDEDNKLKWAINETCCEEFEKEIAKAIEEVSDKL